MRVTYDDVVAAQDRIAGRVRRTPLMPPSGLDDVWLKAEYLQHCGVFKTRGAFNRQIAAVESGEIGDAGIVVASGGNAALAQAFAARELGVRATVFVPRTAPEVKVQRIQEYGAHVHREGEEYAEAYAASVRYAQEHGAALVHAYDQPDVVSGAGTIGAEVLEDEPSIDTIVVAVGGDGLYAGIAAVAHGRVRVVAVEPETCPTLHRAMEAGRPVDVSVSGVASDALGARRLGGLAFAAQEAEPPVSVLVSDTEIIAARAELWSRYRVASEYGAATAYAALLAGHYTPGPAERVALVVCGANTDPGSLATDQLPA